MPYKKDVTIKDVSERAGISISTVSRVLNTPDKVKQETREKVMAAIKELNFSSNSSLAQIRIQNFQNNFVYLFMPSIVNDSISDIAHGASDYLADHNIQTLIWNSNESTEREQQGREFLNTHPAQGAVFIMSIVEDIPLEKTIAMPIATVEYIPEEKNADILHVDNDQGMDLLIEHLVQLGHKNIAFLCGDISSSNASRKIAAYKKALQAHHLPWKTDNIVPTDWNVEGGHRGIRKLLEWAPETTAVICISDVLALGTIHGLRQMGLRCPEDISVTGFDNMPSSAFLTPRITTLNYPAYQMGQDAAKCILKKIEDKKTPNIHKVYPLELIPGESTGKVRLK